jgi:hypothetical protein
MNGGRKKTKEKSEGAHYQQVFIINPNMKNCRVILRASGASTNLTHARLNVLKRTFNDKMSSYLNKHSVAHLERYTLANAQE